MDQESLMHLATGLYPELGKRYDSPFRKHATPPGECYFEWRSGYLRWVDWADSYWHNSNWADVLIKRGLATDFKSALDYARDQLGKVTFEKKSTVERDKFRSNITFIRRDFTPKDREYWRTWNIPIGELIRDYTQAVQSFTYNSKSHPQIFKTIEPEQCYAFTFPSGHVKLYSPFGDPKFLSNCTKNDIFLANYYQNKRVNIVQGHYKDGKIIQAFRFDTKGLQSENTIPDDYILEQWEDRYENNFVMMDADPPGLKATVTFCKHCWERELHSFKPLYWPKPIRESKITDLAEMHELYRGKTYGAFIRIIKENMKQDYKKITEKLWKSNIA